MADAGVYGYTAYIASQHPEEQNPIFQDKGTSG